MNIAALRDQIRLTRTINVNKEAHVVSQISEWKLGNGSFGVYLFEDGYVLIADPSHGYFFGSEASVPFSEPLPKQLYFQGKTFKLVREEKSSIIELFGDGILQEDQTMDSKIYTSDAGDVLFIQKLSGGINFNVSGKIVPEDWVELV